MLSHVAKLAEHAPEPGASLMPHVAAIRRYLRFLGAERTDLDDLVQEVLLAAVRSFTPAEPSLPWLLVTARNALRQHLRRLGRRREVADLDRLDAAWAAQMGDDAGQAKRDALVECLQTLPERSRQAVLLRYHEGLSRESIAAQTGLRVEGVKSLLERVRTALGECIERRVSHE
jgi:RNA polymerase sigma-70 factor, ECF subfamily